ncbi:unnamed protein product [Ectocarpus sp. 12 AP-2014]
MYQPGSPRRRRNLPPYPLFLVSFTTHTAKERHRTEASSGLLRICCCCGLCWCLPCLNVFNHKRYKKTHPNDVIFELRRPRAESSCSCVVTHIYFSVFALVLVFEYRRIE